MEGMGVLGLVCGVCRDYKPPPSYERRVVPAAKAKVDSAFQLSGKERVTDNNPGPLFRASSCLEARTRKHVTAYRQRVRLQL